MPMRIKITKQTNKHFPRQNKKETHFLIKIYFLENTYFISLEKKQVNCLI